jgi:hypothetical protein
VSHCCLTTEEVHQIAFLTMKGWTLVGKEWTKDGFERTTKTSRGCGCHFEERKTPYFPLDEAYEAQIEVTDGP